MTLLRGITWDHPRGYGPLKASEAEAARRFGLEVIWEVRSLKDFGDGSLKDLARDYDLVVMDHPHVGEAAHSGCLVPLDEICTPEALQELEAHSLGPSYTSYAYDGHQWALPVDGACQVGSFRPDLVNAGEPPKDWNGVIAKAKRLRSRNQWMGMALCPTDSLCSFLSLSAQAGDPPRDDASWISRETTVSVLEILRQLRDQIHPSSLEWNPIALYEAMASGAPIACCPMAFAYINYAHPGFREFPLAFTNIPGIRGSVLGGAGLAISRRVTSLELAARYALWVCGGEYQSSTHLLEHGQPWHAAAWKTSAESPLWKAFLATTRSTLQHAYLRPRFEGWPEFQEALGERVHAFLTEDGNPLSVYAELESLYHETVKRHEVI